MTQLALFQSDRIKKSIIMVPIDQLTLSQFNPRLTRPDEYVERLAQRIANNGFEITRALWAYQNGHGYEVFAGGTRLEAAKRAGLKEVPIVLHEGLEDEEVVRLADEDNENDEYHAPVSKIDEWAHYAWLYEQWKDQEKIARAKGTSQGRVSEKVRWHKELSDQVKSFIQQGTLEEGHIREIASIFIVEYFPPWLTTTQAQEELAQHASKRKLTVRQTRDLVDKWKAMLALADELYKKLVDDWQEKFVAKLINSNARTQAEVQQTYNIIVTEQLREAQKHEEELARQRSKAEAERIRLQREKERQEKIQAVLDNVILGDFRKVAQQFEPNGIDVIITDPPYADVQLYEELAKAAKYLLKPGGSLLAMTGQLYLPRVFNLMTPHINYYWTLSYQTPGGQSPQIWPSKVNTFWKPILWFVKGEYEGDWHGDVIKSDTNDNDKRFHEWGQSESGMRRLIENFTQPGDLILDPFFGGGTTGVMALTLDRNFIGIDNDPENIRVSKERIFNLLQELYGNGE